MNTMQANISYIRNISIVLMTLGLVFLSVTASAKGKEPTVNQTNNTKIPSSEVIQKPGNNPQFMRTAPGSIQVNMFPDFDVMAPQNNSQGGPMGLWRYGSCTPNHRVKVVAQNWGRDYDAGAGALIAVTLEIFKQNGQSIYKLTNYLDRLKGNEHQEMVFNPGNFPTLGNYTLKASIKAQGVQEKTMNNNEAAVTITVNQPCP